MNNIVASMYLRSIMSQPIDNCVSVPLDAICIIRRVYHFPTIKVNYYISKGTIYRESTIYDDVFVDIVG